MAVQGAQLNLRAWRKLHGFTQKEVAYAIGIRADNYSRIERGVVAPRAATRSTLYRLKNDVRYRVLVMGR